MTAPGTRQSDHCESLCLQTTVTWQRAEVAAGGESLICRDIRSRELRRAARGFDGQWTVVDTEYDSLDRTVRTSEPYIPNTQTIYWSEHRDYDVLNRVGQIEHPNGGTTGIHYSGSAQYGSTITTTTNPLGNTHEEWKSVLGQVLWTGNPTNGYTAFTYDARGNLKTMSDPANNTTVIDYDLRDRKIQMNDPDKGLWTYQYNRFNELVCQRDANGQVIQQSYDLRGRIVARTDYTGGTCASPSGTVESNTTWTYDTAAFGLGQLSFVQDSISGYEKQIHYDTLGRPAQTRTRLPGKDNVLEDHYERATYDEVGRPFQIFDAARSTASFTSNGVEHEYNEYGYLSKVKNAVTVGTIQETYYTIQAMDARGNITEALYGDGVVKRNAGYSDKTGLAERLRAKKILGPNLQDLELDWDLVGNLTERYETGYGASVGTAHEGARNLSETFSYDAMNRLTQSNLSGDASDTQALTYNNIGNITSKTGLGSYNYNTCNAGPHAVCSTGLANYAYDANGNQTGGDGRTITYIVADLPKIITKGSHTTEFWYGPDRARFKRVDTNGGNSTTTLYLGSVEKVYNPDGTIQWKRSIGGIALVTQTVNSAGQIQDTDTKYLLKDHLGTLSLILDNDGAVVEEYYFDAWGKRRPITRPGTIAVNPFGIFSKPTTTRGYTEHEMLDEVGLVHMNGRIYDETLARFVQADPIIQDPFKSESLNRYSYVWNNPLNATDPSGFCRGEGAAGADSLCQSKQDAEKSKQKVAEGKDSCSSGSCANYVGKSGKEYSVNKSDLKEFKQANKDNLKEGMKDKKNGVSYASTGNAAGNAGGGSGGGGGRGTAPAAVNSSNPKASGSGAIRDMALPDIEVNLVSQKDIDKKALSMVKDTLPASRKEKREYGGVIYLKDGEVHSTLTRARHQCGTLACSVNLTQDFLDVQRMKGAVILGDWHTHAESSYSISEGDVIGTNSVAILNERGHDFRGSYYSTPRGAVYFWTHGMSNAREANRNKILVGEVPWK